MNKPLSRAFNIAVNHIASLVLPRGFEVSENAPQCFESLASHYLATGKIRVWNGASESTIFACPETNYAFRAWHDSKHICYGLQFTFEGETRAAELQCDDIRALYDGESADYYCAILQAEIIGQFRYQEINGKFPVNQMDFVNDCLINPDAALHCIY